MLLFTSPDQGLRHDERRTGSPVCRTESCTQHNFPCREGGLFCLSRLDETGRDFAAVRQCHDQCSGLPILLSN